MGEIDKKVETPKEKQKNYYCTLDMLENGNFTKISEESYNYKMRYKNKEYLVFRVGKCDYKKCKAVCCKFCHIRDGEENSSYWSNFGISTKYGIKFKENCKKLIVKSNKCSAWDKKCFPEACKQFPHPNDSTYWLVYDKCSFKFMIDSVLKEYKGSSHKK